MNKINVANSDTEILRCFDVMKELRTKLEKSDFLQTVRALQTDGYTLLYIQQDNRVLALAGYRIYSNLFMGKHLYVDDLVTAEDARSQGYGEALIKWLRAIAKSEQCEVLHLDSGIHRGRAHKFYFEQGMTIASYHFSEQL